MSDVLIECPLFLVDRCDEFKNQEGFVLAKYPECRECCHYYRQFNGIAKNSGINFMSKALCEIQWKKDDDESFMRYYNIKSDIVNWVLDGNNLLITTPYTENETSILVLKLMYGYFWELKEYYLYEWVRGKYINVPEFIFEIETYNTRNSDDFKLKIDELKKVDLVVWDDITLIPFKETSRDLITTIVNTRFRDGKANIFAGLEIENPQDAFGEILFQKLKRCEHIQITKPFILEKIN